MKIVICGAHFTPAQAVIEKFKRRHWIEVIYIGRAHTREGDSSPSAESRILPKMGVKFIPITAGRLQRYWGWVTITSLLKLPIGFVQAFYYIAKERPDVVLSFGGYLSVPVVFAAWLFNIPVVIHEQTLVTALANKIGSFFADKILVSYEVKYSFPKEKVIVTGNPLRADLIDSSKSGGEIDQWLKSHRSDKLPVVYITGGNQGAHVINEAVGQILPELTKKAVVVHSSGDSKYQDYDRLMARQTALDYPERYLVVKWVGNELGLLLRQSDLVVGRAGANTLMELAYFGVPALLIPLPYLNHDEQMVNARYYQKLGLAEVLTQSELSGSKLLTEIEQLLAKLPALKKRALAAKSVVKQTAADAIAFETLMVTHDQTK